MPAPASAGVTTSGAPFGGTELLRAFGATKLLRAFGATKLLRAFGATPTATLGPCLRTAGSPGAGRPGAAAGCAAGGLLGRALRAGAGHVAFVDPDLDTNPAEGGLGFVEAVVDVCAKRVQRHLALAVELRAAHLRATESAGALDPDATGTAPHRALLRLAHGAAELNTGGQLLGGGLRNQLGIDLRVLHLEDVQLDLLAGQLLQVIAHPLRLGTVAADDDARAGRVDVDPHSIPSAFNLHR